MRSHAKASPAGSPARGGSRLGRIVRGAFATRGSSGDADGSGAPSRRSGSTAHLAALALAIAALFGVLAAPAGASGVHPRLPSLAKSLTRVCGTATDSHGNLYVIQGNASSTVSVFDPSGAAITSFTVPSFVCGVSVDSSGNVYLAPLAATGSVLKYKPSEYPPVSSPTPTAYELDKAIGESSPGANDGDGIVDSGPAMVAVDPASQDLYVSHPGVNETQVFKFEGFVNSPPETFEFGNLPAACEHSATEPIEYISTAATLRERIDTALEKACSNGANQDFSLLGTTSALRITFEGQFATQDLAPLSCAAVSSAAGNCHLEPASSFNADGAASYIAQYESDGTLLTDSIGSGLAGASYSGIGVYGATGRIFAFDDLHHEIAVFNPGAGTPAFTIDGSATPTGTIAAGNKYGTALTVDQQTGHVFAYDGPDAAVDEFKASGEYVTQLTEELKTADQYPAGIAIDRSGGVHDGVIYVGYTHGFTFEGGVEAFGPMTYDDGVSLSAVKNGTGGGTIEGGSSEEPNAIDCGTTCEAEFEPGTEVTLTASADAGSVFKEWSGCDSTEGADDEICKVTVNANMAVAATFIKRTLTVAKAGPGVATIVSSPPGIDCGATCEANFGDGEAVTLSASAPSGSRLKSWSGCDEVEGELCKVTMNANRSVSAYIAAEPTISATEASNPGTSGATIKAKVNPNGELTSWHFEYVADAEYQANGFENAERSPASDNSAGAGNAATTVSQTITGLAPATTYHFRLVATNFASPEGGTAGERATFTTYEASPPPPSCPNDALRTGPSAKLPDCRAYEQASSVDKNGIDVLGRPNAMAASANGDAVLYYALNGQTEGGGPQSFPVYVSNRGASGWLADGVLPPVSYGNSAAILGWLPDLSTVFSRANDFLGTGNVYLLGRDSADGSIDTISEAGAPDHIVGASADGRVVYFQGSVNDLPLVPGAIAGKRNLYAWDRDTNAVTLAGVLPESSCGSPPCVPSGGSSVEASYPVADHAVSETGDAYFTDAGTGQLYLRRDPFGSPSTFHVSASQRTDCAESPGSCSGIPDPKPTQPATFQTATPDGAHAFFTSAEELTDDSFTGPEPVTPPQPPIVIGRSNSDGTGKEAEFIPTSADWIAVSPESASPRYLYWTNTEAGTIGRAAIDGSNPDPELITGLENPEEIAVDSAHIYWAEARDRAAGHGTIGRADPNGGSVEMSFISGAGNPHGVAVSPESASPRYVYWTNGTSPDIGRAGIDGANPNQSFIKRSKGGPVGIAVNATNLYWNTFGNKLADGIVKTNLNGGEEEFTQDFAGEQRGIAVDSSHVYLAAPQEDTIRRYNLDLSSNGFYFVSGIDEVSGVAIDAGHLYWSANPPVVQTPAKPGNDLYRYDAESGDLTDLAADTSAENGAEVRGVLGASQDGEYVYFVANADLDEGGPAEAGNCSGSAFGFGSTRFQGECSLYLAHGGDIAFVARLDIDELTGDGRESDAANWRASVQGKAARVSADGKTLLFRSQRRLTGYDNHGSRCVKKDGNSVERVPGPCTELYRYNIDDGLSCVSCTPTGAAPTWDVQLSQIAPGNGIPNIRSTTQLRNLSADGNRIFFESADKLVAGDVNGDGACPLVPVAASNNGRVPACLDVYEWEANSTGSCHSSAQNGGCLYLVSSGTGTEPSFFLDASKNGNDAFFFTQQQLVPGDTDGLRDVYDARFEGGLASQHASPPPACQGDACHGEASSAQGTPSVATPAFQGPGNQPSGKNPTSRRCPKGERKVHSKGKVRCVKRHHKKRHAKKHRRLSRPANHNRRASR